jgi:hypothetical protein
MSFKNEKRLLISSGNTDILIDPSTSGYVGSLSLKYASPQTGNLSIQIIRPNIADVSKIQTVSSKALSTETDAIYVGSSVYFSPGNTLRITSDIGADADAWIQFNDERKPVSAWFTCNNADVLASSSSSSSSSKSSDSSSSKSSESSGSSSSISSSSKSSASSSSKSSQSSSSNSSSSSSSSEDYSQSSNSSSSMSSKSSASSQSQSSESSESSMGFSQSSSSSSSHH